MVDETLEDLIRQQAEDDSSSYVILPPGESVRTISESATGYSLEELEVSRTGQRRKLRKRGEVWTKCGSIIIRPATYDWVYIAGFNAWSMEDEGRARIGEIPCPVCGGAELRLTVYCLSCDRTGADGVIAGRFPGLPVGMSDRLDVPGEYLERPKFDGTGALKGGKA